MIMTLMMCCVQFVIELFRKNTGQQRNAVPEHKQ